MERHVGTGVSLILVQVYPKSKKIFSADTIGWKTTELYRNYGTGIGLYYAMRLAELHKGVPYSWTIVLKGGSVFTLQVPMAEDDLSGSGENLPQLFAEQRRSVCLKCRHWCAFWICLDLMKTSESRFKVLVIDDDEEIVNYIRTYLTHAISKCGLQVRPSRLMKIWRAFLPDLILCDIMMPGIDGLQFCRCWNRTLIIATSPSYCSPAKSFAQWPDSGGCVMARMRMSPNRSSRIPNRPHTSAVA